MEAATAVAAKVWVAMTVAMTLAGAHAAEGGGGDGGGTGAAAANIVAAAIARNLCWVFVAVLNGFTAIEIWLDAGMSMSAGRCIPPHISRASHFALVTLKRHDGNTGWSAGGGVAQAAAMTVGGAQGAVMVGVVARGGRSAVETRLGAPAVGVAQAAMTGERGGGGDGGCRGGGRRKRRWWSRWRGYRRWWARWWGDRGGEEGPGDEVAEEEGGGKARDGAALVGLAHLVRSRG